MQRVRRLAIITTLATFLLITVGGFVRASGAGLGCPDWPRCHGRWFPPTSLEQLPPEHRVHFNITKAWIEYGNRMVGMTIGFLIIATFVQCLRYARGTRGIVGPVTVALLLVGFEGWLGGQVVKHELDPRMVTIHLLLGLAIAGVLIYAAFNTFQDRLIPRRSPLEGNDRKLGLAVLASCLLGLVQVSLGSFVRGGLEVVAASEHPPGRGEWIGQIGWVDPAHRNLSIWMSLLVVLSWWWSRKTQLRHGAWVRRVATLNLVAVLAQVGAGVVLAYAALPPAFQVIHLTLASWLMGGLIVLALLLRRELATEELTSATLSTGR